MNTTTFKTLMLDCLKKSLSDPTRPPNLPEGGAFIWRAFLDLCRTRTGNGYGPNPISYSEIAGYAQLYRWPMEPRHIDLILALDGVWLGHAHKRNETAPDGVPRLPPMSSQPISAASFDAVWS